MKIKLKYLLLLAYFTSCSYKPDEDAVKIKQIETDQQIYIRCDSTYSRIVKIHFPLAFELKNSSIKNRKVRRVDYYYCGEYGKSYLNSISRGWSATYMVYQRIDSVLVKVEYDYKKRDAINRFQSQEFIVYTQHYVDTSSARQSLFSSYSLGEMKRLKQVTLDIGTMQELARDHPKITETFLKGDSISFSTSEKLIETFIYLPVEY
jgi:hypothetical protein